MFNEEQLATIRKIVSDMTRHLPRQQIIQSDIPPKTIKKRHIEDVVIVFGLAADRPTNADTGVKAYFATDNDTFSCWNGTAWVDEVLT
jgi:hypothetical protein